MKSKFFIFIFKHRFRRRALNNFLRIKKLKNFYIINLSGLIKYYLFGLPLINLIYKFREKFKNFILISCDGIPQIKYNGINLWFGGTSYKVPNEFKSFKNNCHFFENFSKKEENLLDLYPYKPLNIKSSNSTKIIFIGGFDILENKIVNMIWSNEKDKIIKRMSLIDEEIFWKKYNLINDDRLQFYYIQLKERLRFEFIMSLKKVFTKDFLLVGSKWKRYVLDAKEDEFELSKITNFYNGNICLDFGSKWGSNIFYPRSVEIIEQGGLLVQSKQQNSSEEFYNLDVINNFNSLDELITKLQNLLSDKELFNKKFQKQFYFFNNTELNYPTFEKIYEISKKNN
tara:strand:- start:137 stop:1162 length:1026 start_codon:yes stop_codon:yes gene_type:complete